MIDPRYADVPLTQGNLSNFISALRGSQPQSAGPTDIPDGPVPRPAMAAPAAAPVQHMYSSRVSPAVPMPPTNPPAFDQTPDPYNAANMGRLMPTPFAQAPGNLSPSTPVAMAQPLHPASSGRMMTSPATTQISALLNGTYF